jgi:hypothetical protein
MWLSLGWKLNERGSQNILSEMTLPNLEQKNNSNMKIFISHSLNDSNLVEIISRDLILQNHQIIKIDKAAFANNNAMLVDTIKNSFIESDALIFLYTENSINSSWQSFEFDAFSQYSIQSNSKKIIIPILIDEVPIPPRVINYLSIRVKKSEIKTASLRIIEALNRFQGELIAKEEQTKIVKERIEKNAADYVEETFSRLEKREISLRKKANLWYWIGYGSLVTTIIVAIIFTICSSIPDPENWFKIAFLGLKSTVIIVLLIASSKYSFNLAKTYMNESLKNSDRIHAISFGKFYLQIFGDKVDSSEIKDVFGDWNLDKKSNFLKMDTNDFDPKLVEIITKTIEVLKDKK